MYKELTKLISKGDAFLNGDDVRDAVNKFCIKDHREEGYVHYHEILESSGLKFECEIMASADVSGLDGKTVVALLFAANRKWYWCGEDCYGEFMKRGCIRKWLDRLAEIDGMGEIPTSMPVHIKIAKQFRMRNEGYKDGSKCPKCEFTRVCNGDCSLCAKAEINNCICTLNGREVAVISMRYGLLDGARHSIKDIAGKFHTGEDTIKKIHDRGIRKLRHPSRSKIIKNVSFVVLFHTSPYQMLFKSVFGKDIVDEALNQAGQSLLSAAKEKVLNQETKDDSPSKEAIQIFLQNNLVNGKPPYSEVPLEDLNFSVETFNALKKQGVDSLADIISDAGNALLLLPYDKYKSAYMEINDMLSYLGIQAYQIIPKRDL